MRSWLDCCPKQLSEKDTEGHEVPALKLWKYSVLLCLMGSKGSHYAEMELMKLIDRNPPIAIGSYLKKRSKESSTPNSRRTGLKTAL